MERIISEKLQALGMPCHLEGFTYCKQAVKLALNDIKIVHGSMTNKLYPAIAQKCNAKNAATVERNIRHAIETVWENYEVNEKGLKEVLGPAARPWKMVNGEFIATLAERIKLETLDKAS